MNPRGRKRPLLDPPPQAGEPAAAPEKLPPITLATMKLVATTVADDIEAEQARMVETGCRRRPDPAKLEEARVLRKLGELVDRLRSSKEALALLGFRAAPPAGGDAP